MLDTLQVILVYTFIFGSFYLLVTLGFTIICGVLRIFNLGYGITFVVAIYGVWIFIKEMGLGLAPAILAMIVLQCLFTLGVIYFPIVKRYAEKEELLLTSLLLVSLIVEEAVNFQYPVTAGVNIPTTIIAGSIKIGSTSIPNQMLIAAGIGIVTTVLMLLFLLKTKMGLVIRAVSQDTESSQLMGSNVNVVYAIAMILAVIPPTIAILTIAPVWSIDPQLGGPLLQIAILVSILGGLGNIRGTMMAAYIVGFVAAAVAFMVNPSLMNLATLLLVLIVLMFKPQGIARSESLW
jgi:branched-chain amino acid transport system permease protein